VSQRDIVTVEDLCLNLVLEFDEEYILIGNLINDLEL